MQAIQFNTCCYAHGAVAKQIVYVRARVCVCLSVYWIALLYVL